MKTPIFRRKGYAMKDDTVVALRQPESFSDDPLTEILRAGARQLLGQAIEAEVAAHIEAHADLTDASGRRRIVRHGHMPEREVQTGIGAVTVKRPRVRDRDPQATGGRLFAAIYRSSTGLRQSIVSCVVPYPRSVERGSSAYVFHVKRRRHRAACFFCGAFGIAAQTRHDRFAGSGFPAQHWPR